jgi:hypothetical protein
VTDYGVWPRVLVGETEKKMYSREKFKEPKCLYKVIRKVQITMRYDFISTRLAKKNENLCNVYDKEDTSYCLVLEL